MKKKMNYYLILLLTITFMVGCTNVEDVSVTDKETNSNNSEKEKTITTVVNESAVDEKPTEQNNDLFSGYKLIEIDGGDLSGYREPNVAVDIVMGTESIGLLRMNTGN